MILSRVTIFYALKFVVPVCYFCYMRNALILLCNFEMWVSCRSKKMREIEINTYGVFDVWVTQPCVCVCVLISGIYSEEGSE